MERSVSKPSREMPGEEVAGRESWFVWDDGLDVSVVVVVKELVQCREDTEEQA